MAKGIIVLDPGHGKGHNISPAIKAYAEGTRMWELSVILKKKLEAAGYTVLTTRTQVTDNPSLSARGQLAGKNKALLFLSLHSNAVGSSGKDDRTRGSEVFYSITNNTNKAQAAELSKTVSQLFGHNDRGAKMRTYPDHPSWDYYGVIRAAAQSGCTKAFLIEHGFHTSTADTSWLLQDASLEKLATAECTWICQVLGNKTGSTAITTTAPTAGILLPGSKVTIMQGAKYGGLSNAKDTPVPAGQLFPKIHTVKKVQANGGRDEALLEEIVSWVPTKYLTVATTNPPESKEEPLYRVRTSWDACDTQKGSYTSLDEAKKQADSLAKEGYKVFDNTGNIVYLPKQPTYENPIIATRLGSAEQSYKAIVKVNPNITREFVELYYTIGQQFGIEPTAALAQSILETGWFKSQQAVEYHNYGGLGATGVANAPIAKFNTEREGVLAEFQHLWAYASALALPTDDLIVDPRFKLVTRGSARTWLDLGGKWAVPGYDKTKYSSLEAAKQDKASYGDKILAIRDQLLSTPFDQPTAKTSKYYTDIPAGHWSIDAFDGLTELGIINGTGDGKAGFTEEWARTVQLTWNTLRHINKDTPAS